MENEEANALWESFRNSGDESAFDQLYRVYRPRVMRYCRARLGSEDAAEDVTDGVFTYLYLARPECKKSFEAMLIFFARRRCLNQRSQAANLSAVPENAPAAACEPEVEVLESHEVVRLALSVLTADERDIIYLQFFHDMTLDEIAFALESTRAKVKWRRRKALAKLKRILGKNEKEWPRLLFALFF